MIVGNDVSVFQGQIDYSIYSNNSNFIIAKATEGTGLIDGWYANNRTQARQYNLPFGSYHFAHPDLGNTPETEAKYFCDVIDGDPIRQGELLALDYEVNYNDPVTWCKAWLDYVSAHYNDTKPLIYLNQSTASNYDWSPVISAGYGLWLASYTYDPTNNTGNTGKWPFMAIQQWTDKQNVPGISGVIDGDCFFGTADDFRKYGYQPPVVAIPTPEVVTTPTVETPVVKTPVETQPTEPITTPISQEPVVLQSPVVTVSPSNSTQTIIENIINWLYKILINWNS